MTHLTDVIESEKKNARENLMDIDEYQADSLDIIITQAMTKAALAVLEQLECSECNGSGARSTPSDYSPCSECDGTGFNLNEGCLNDHIYQIKTTLTTNK